MIPFGREFYKVSGSGNDFVVLDARAEPFLTAESAEFIRAVCSRRTGVGADGLVLLEASGEGAFFMKYFNSDGSRATLCGNAALCCTRLAVELDVASPEGVRFTTDAGPVTGRIREGLPEIDLGAVERAVEAVQVARQPAELGIGFTRVGVPHLVVRCRDASAVPIERRGAELRHHPTLADGANVNFVSPAAQGAWELRTFERGVEGETLACGTGAVAAAVVLAGAGGGSATEPSPIRTVLRTRSGSALEVTLRAAAGRWLASLRGEGRIVFRGVLGELPADFPGLGGAAPEEGASSQ